MRWHLSYRADRRAAALADRHYNRQKIGAAQFAPAGRCLVLLTEQADALWITSWPYAEYVKHAWAGAWVCSCFRNESMHLSSELIREAIAVTRWFRSFAPKWRHDPEPMLGMITFVNANKTQRRRSKRAQPGQCFIYAGFEHVGYTVEEELDALQLLLPAMPAAAPPCVVQEVMELAL